MQQLPAAIERDPQRAVRSGGDSARRTARTGRELAHLAAAEIDLAELVRHHPAYPHVALLVERESVRVARHLVLDDLPGTHIQPAHASCALHREPDRALAVGDERVRIAARWRLVLHHLAGGRVQMPDRAVAVPGVPRCVVGIDQHTVRVRAGRQVPLLERLRLRVEACDLVPVHDADEDASIGRRCRVARELRRGDGPLLYLAFEIRVDARLDRVVGAAGDCDAYREHPAWDERQLSFHGLPPASMNAYGTAPRFPAAETHATRRWEIESRCEPQLPFI